METRNPPLSPHIPLVKKFILKLFLGKHLGWRWRRVGGRSQSQRRSVEAKENRRSGFRRVKAGWIRTRMWFAARTRTCIKHKNRKMTTIVVFIHGPFWYWQHGAQPVLHWWIHSFIHSMKTHGVHLPCARLCSNVKSNKLVLLSWVLIVSLPYPSSQSPVVWGEAVPGCQVHEEVWFQSPCLCMSPFLPKDSYPVLRTMATSKNTLSGSPWGLALGEFF